MKRLHMMLLLVALSTFALVEADASRDGERTRAVQAQTCDEATPPGERRAQQACCQANKGVCGCRAGKIVCCDGSFSQGCSCNRDEGPATS